MKEILKKVEIKEVLYRKTKETYIAPYQKGKYEYVLLLFNDGSRKHHA